MRIHGDNIIKLAPFIHYFHLLIQFQALRVCMTLYQALYCIICEDFPDSVWIMDNPTECVNVQKAKEIT